MITFSHFLVEDILSGRKTQTRRLGKKRWNVGSIHKVTRDRFNPNAVFGKVRILDVRQERIGDITEEDARAEGFDNRKTFLRIFQGLNRDRLPALGWEDELVWAITFEVVRE